MDIIIYISDLIAFRVEAEEIYQTKNDDIPHPASVFLCKDDQDDIVFKADKINVVYGEEYTSLCLVRTSTPELLETVVSMEIIGECINNEYVFSDGGQDKYESVYDTTEREINGETYTPPYMIGVFA